MRRFTRLFRLSVRARDSVKGFRKRFIQENQRRLKMKTTKVNQYQMSAGSNVTKSLVFATVLACLIVAGAGSAFAVVQHEVLYQHTNQTFPGKCCFSFGETVSVFEPAKISPVVVTFSTDYLINVTDVYFVGLSVNGGACETLSYGSRVLADIATLTSDNYLSASFQWIVPASSLAAGSNTFELCGGGENSTSDSITIGENTLAVRISN
jgi:hypothetical protein